MPAFVVLRQQDQVIAGLLVDTVETAARGNVAFAAEDHLDSRPAFFFRFLIQFLRGLVHVHRAVHIAVVGDGNAVHAQLHSPLQQFLRLGSAVQQAVLGMHMQMCKRYSHRISYSAAVTAAFLLFANTVSFIAMIALTPVVTVSND